MYQALLVALVPGGAAVIGLVRSLTDNWLLVISVVGLVLSLLLFLWLRAQGRKKERERDELLEPPPPPPTLQDIARSLVVVAESPGPTVYIREHHTPQIGNLSIVVVGTSDVVVVVDAITLDLSDGVAKNHFRKVEVPIRRGEKTVVSLGDIELSEAVAGRLRLSTSGWSHVGGPLKLHLKTEQGEVTKHIDRLEWRAALVTSH